MSKFTSEWLAARQPAAAREMRSHKRETADNDVEKPLHQQIIKFCERHRWIACHGAMHRPTFRTKGEPDFIILAPRERVLFIECKSADGDTSTDQDEFHAMAARNGHTVHIVRTFLEFIKVVNQANVGLMFNQHGDLYYQQVSGLTFPPGKQ